MKKTLILATIGLLASLAQPAFASDSPGTAIDAQGITKLNPKESMAVQKTFVIAESADKVKERPGIAFGAKSTDSSTDIGTKGDYVLTTYDSALAEPGIASSMFIDRPAPAKPGVITANKTPTVGLDLKTAPMTSASGLATSTYTGVEITLKI